MNGHVWEADGNEDPVAAVHIDGKEKITQGENVNFLGPLAYSIEFVGVVGFVGRHSGPNLKEFCVKLGLEAITALVVGKKGATAVQVPLDQQRSADMNAHIVQPFSRPKTMEVAHVHPHGQVARDFVGVRKFRGWRLMRQGSGNITPPVV